MKHFTFSELLKSDTAVKQQLWNGASREAEENLRSLVEQVLDPLREAYDHHHELHGKRTTLLLVDN